MPESKEQRLPSIEHLQLGEVFAALADPCRRLIVTELLGEPAGARRQCSSFGVQVSKSTMTHHFRILREAGLTIQYNHGNRAELELRKADVDKRFPGLLDLVTKSKEQSNPVPAVKKIRKALAKSVGTRSRTKKKS